MKSSALALVVAMAVALPARSATEAEVGDPDSFGHSVTYLGYAQTPSVWLHPTCIANPPSFPLFPGDRCTILARQPAVTTFNEGNLDSIVLPANATRSLLCHTLSPGLFINYFNSTSNWVAAQVNSIAIVTIQNEVLDDPTLLDPRTGKPYGGRLERRLAIAFDHQPLLGGAGQLTQMAATRECGLGLISKQLLVNSFGLSEMQATAFFTKPMTLTFGISGSASGLDHGLFSYNIRLYGDN